MSSNMRKLIGTFIVAVGVVAMAINSQLEGDELSVTHHGMIFSVSDGQPGAHIDKCIVRYDKLLIDMRLNCLLSDLEWKCYDNTEMR